MIDGVCEGGEPRCAHRTSGRRVGGGSRKTMVCRRAGVGKVPRWVLKTVSFSRKQNVFAIVFAWSDWPECAVCIFSCIASLPLYLCNLFSQGSLSGTVLLVSRLHMCPGQQMKVSCLQLELGFHRNWKVFLPPAPIVQDFCRMWDWAEQSEQPLQSVSKRPPIKLFFPTLWCLFSATFIASTSLTCKCSVIYILQRNLKWIWELNFSDPAKGLYKFFHLLIYSPFENGNNCSCVLMALNLNLCVHLSCRNVWKEALGSSMVSYPNF